MEDVGWLYNLVVHLPREGAVGREQGRVDFRDLFDEWMNTLLQFGAGKKVRSPSSFREPEMPESKLSDAPTIELDLTDPQQIEAFLDQA